MSTSTAAPGTSAAGTRTAPLEEGLTMRALVMKAAGSAAIEDVSEPAAADYDARVDMVARGIWQP